MEYQPWRDRGIQPGQKQRAAVYAWHAFVYYHQKRHGNDCAQQRREKIYVCVSVNRYVRGILHTRPNVFVRIHVSDGYPESVLSVIRWVYDWDGRYDYNKPRKYSLYAHAVLCIRQHQRYNRHQDHSRLCLLDAADVTAQPNTGVGIRQRNNYLHYL